MKSLIALFLIVCSLNNAIAGGPWTQAKHGAYVQVSYNIIAENNKLFSTLNNENAFYLPRAITDQTVALYMEYGISDQFTIIGYLPFKFTNNSKKVLLPSAKYQSTYGSLNSLGNINITGKYQFYNTSVVAAVALGVDLPSSQTDKNTRLSTGHQTTAIQPAIHIGHSKNKYYTHGKIGYNYRTDLTDEYVASMEVGYKFYKSMFAIVAIDILQSTKEQQSLKENFTYLYPDQQEYIASTLKFSSTIYNNMGINLHLTILTIHANYVQKGPAMGGSLYLKF